jgi:2-hydroxy-3-oxopropionate reductase
VDPAKVIEVLSGGLAATGVLNLRGQKMIQGDFEPGGRAELHLKDLGIALATGQALNVPLPVTSVVAEKYRALIAEGLGHLDHSALLNLQQDTAGFRLSLNQ